MTEPEGTAEISKCPTSVPISIACSAPGKRRPFITPKLREKLWPYLGGIARQNKLKAIEVGGVEDHVHILLSLPPTVSIAKAMQLLKGGSSKWIHENFAELRHFAWQEEYGAFTVSASQVDKIADYIRGQGRTSSEAKF